MKLKYNIYLLFVGIVWCGLKELKVGDVFPAKPGKFTVLRIYHDSHPFKRHLEVQDERGYITHDIYNALTGKAENPRRPINFQGELYLQFYYIGKQVGAQGETLFHYILYKPADPTAFYAGTTNDLHRYPRVEIIGEPTRFPYIILDAHNIDELGTAIIIKIPGHNELYILFISYSQEMRKYILKPIKFEEYQPSFTPLFAKYTCIAVAQYSCSIMTKIVNEIMTKVNVNELAIHESILSYLVLGCKLSAYGILLYFHNNSGRYGVMEALADRRLFKFLTENNKFAQLMQSYWVYKRLVKKVDMADFALAYLFGQFNQNSDNISELYNLNKHLFSKEFQYIVSFIIKAFSACPPKSDFSNIQEIEDMGQPIHSSIDLCIYKIQADPQDFRIIRHGIEVTQKTLNITQIISDGNDHYLIITYELYKPAPLQIKIYLLSHAPLSDQYSVETIQDIEIICRLVDALLEISCRGIKIYATFNQLTNWSIINETILKENIFNATIYDASKILTYIEYIENGKPLFLHDGILYMYRMITINHNDCPILYAIKYEKMKINLKDRTFYFNKSHKPKPCRLDLLKPPFTELDNIASNITIYERVGQRTLLIIYKYNAGNKQYAYYIGGVCSNTKDEFLANLTSATYGAIRQLKDPNTNFEIVGIDDEKKKITVKYAYLYWNGERDKEGYIIGEFSLNEYAERVSRLLKNIFEQKDKVRNKIERRHMVSIIMLLILLTIISMITLYYYSLISFYSSMQCCIISIISNSISSQYFRKYTILSVIIWIINIALLCCYSDIIAIYNVVYVIVCVILGYNRQWYDWDNGIKIDSLQAAVQ